MTLFRLVWQGIVRGYLRVIEPVADWMVARRINPNTITTVGTLSSVAGGVIYGSGHIMTAGWVVGLTALFDVLDGTVARRTGRSTTFGAFYDSTLDRVADGAVLGGLTYFYATSVAHGNPVMVAVCLAGLMGAFLTSYTRARAESLGIDAKVGMLQRPERVVLLSAPQAFFGLLWGGYVLMGIVILLTVTSWVTAVQRIAFVYRATTGAPSAPSATAAPAPAAPAAPAAPPAGEPPRSRTPTPPAGTERPYAHATARSVLKGE